MVGALAGLQEHVKLAREYALEGLYDTSIIFFDGALAQINKYLSLLHSHGFSFNFVLISLVWIWYAGMFPLACNVLPELHCCVEKACNF